MSDHLPSAVQLAVDTPIRIRNESPAYRAARTALLAEEIELRRHIARVAAQRRALPPGGAVDGDYAFIGANGEAGFPDLFGRHDTLLIYSFMYGPDSERPCPMCTNLLGPLAANGADIRQQLALAVVARSPYERVAAFAQERGWQDLPLYQDTNDNYSRDYRGLLPDGSEVPSMSVFTRRDGTIRHFWTDEFSGESADPGQDPRGAPDLAPLWNILDLTPGGRDPDWYPSLRY